MIDQHKYVTFRSDEFVRFMDVLTERIASGSGPYPECPEPIRDCVVLRHQDVHTSGALYAYGSSCLATADMLEYHGLGSGDLREIADWAGEQADRARTAQRKLPTL